MQRRFLLNIEIVNFEFSNKPIILTSSYNISMIKLFGEIKIW